MEINSETKIYALIGNPVKYSLSPLIHNAAFEELELNCVYLAFKTKNAEDAINGMKCLNIAGGNVTVPYKVEVIGYLDEIEQTAEKIGAVNTIVNKKGHLKGHNTDWIGAIRALEEKTGIKNKNILMLGAGGTARAIGFGVKEKGGNLTILNRTSHKAKELAGEVGCSYGGLDKMEESVDYADILINTTPVGMYPDTKNSLVPEELLKEDIIVFDVIYNPPKTKLIKDAEEKGCKTINGLKMLVYQGAAAFEIWTGKKAPVELMEKVVVRS